MSEFSGSNNHHNIEIKEMPETSKIHKTESINIHIPNFRNEKDSNKEGSFMTQENLHTDQQVNKEFANELKEEPRVNDQTESTMNIKSFSNFESIKDSIKRKSLISPEVEINDIDIPQLDDQQIMDHNEIDEHVLDPELDPELDENFDFEKEYYKTKEDLNLQNENHLFNHSHNSTMLMESVKDNQISQVWGKANKTMMKCFCKI